MIKIRTIFQIALWILFVFPIDTTAQLNANISRDKENKSFISLAGSYGQVFEREAWFYGFSGDFSRRLDKINF